MAGRPTKDTPRRRTLILDALARGVSRQAAAAVAGIHRDTLKEWESKDPAFSEACTRAADVAEDAYVKIIAKAAAIDWRAAAWMLERRMNDRYGAKAKVDVSFDATKAAEQVAAETGMTTEAVLAGVEAILRDEPQ